MKKTIMIKATGDADSLRVLIALFKQIFQDRMIVSPILANRYESGFRIYVTGEVNVSPLEDGLNGGSHP